MYNRLRNGHLQSATPDDMPQVPTGTAQMALHRSEGGPMMQSCLSAHAVADLQYRISKTDSFAKPHLHRDKKAEWKGKRWGINEGGGGSITVCVCVCVCVGKYIHTHVCANSRTRRRQGAAAINPTRLHLDMFVDESDQRNGRDATEEGDRPDKPA